jgi:energy-coupling factor transporter ATP-binding protein EcfA2
MKINNLKFGVSNFRVFDKMSEFEFSPITFLTGPNSSGKSSIMKALNLFSENSLNKPFPNLLSFESKTDLESIQSILNDNTKNLTFTFKISLFEPNDSEITLIYNNGLDIESLFVLNQKKITEFSTLIKTEFKYQNEIVFLIDEFDPSFQSIVNHNNCFIDLFLFKKIIIKHLKKEKKIYEKILKESNEEIEDVLSDSGNYFKVKLEDNKLIDLEIEMNKSISELENQIIKNWIPQENIEDFDEIHLILFNNKTNSLKPILKSVILIFKNILNNNYKFKGFSGKIKNTEIGEYIYNNGATILIDKIEKSLKNSLRINFIPVVKKTNNDRVLNLNDSKNYFDSIFKKYYEYKNQLIKTDYNEINSILIIGYRLKNLELEKK